MYKIEEFEGIKGYFRKMVIDNHIYLKPSAMIDAKVKTYFMKLRKTSFVEDLQNRFGQTDFLKGVLGNVMWFTVVDDWLGKEAPNEVKGEWVHFSIAFPLLCMTGTSSLMYAATEIQTAMEELVTVKDQSRELAVALAKNSKMVSDLKAELKAANSCLDDLDDVVKGKLLNPPAVVKLKKSIVVDFNGQSKYTLSYINKVFKEHNITLVNNDESEYCFSAIYTKYALKLDLAEQLDNFHFKAVKGSYAYDYKSTRQRKAVENENGLEVRYFGLTKKGFELCTQQMFNDKCFNEAIIIKYI